MTRTNVREIAVHLVYEMNFNEMTAGEAIEALLQEDYYPSLKAESDIYEEKPTGKQLTYLTGLVMGVQDKRQELDETISRLAIGWRLDRISRIARAIMQVAMYESLYVEDVPTAAAISEAVELTRKYEDEDVVSFVNGILGAFSREEPAK